VAFRIDPTTEFGARVERRLREETVIWLTTVAADGTPQPSPVWFYWDGASFLIYSLAGSPRQRNLDRNPRVSLHFDGNGRGGDIIVFTGQASIDRRAPAAHAMPEYAAKYREGFRRIGLSPEQFSAKYPLPVRIAPEQVRGH
jgi:PPOX class probable F420-dependent enzyme